MGDQTRQRLDLMSQAADACRDYLAAVHRLATLKDRSAFLGTVTDAEFQGTALAHLDAAVVVELFHPTTGVIASVLANYADAGNAGKNRRVLNQIAPVI